MGLKALCPRHLLIVQIAIVNKVGLIMPHFMSSGVFMPMHLSTLHVAYGLSINVHPPVLALALSAGGISGLSCLPSLPIILIKP